MSKLNVFARRMSSNVRPNLKFEGSVRLLPMPQLSPHMISGTLLKWYAKEGAIIPAYELIADVRPDQLTELKEFDERTDMELELQEDMFIAKYLCHEGQEVKGGAPLAILCEMEEDIEEAKKLVVRGFLYVTFTPLQRRDTNSISYFR